MKITVGIPAFNEEENIATVINELKKVTESIIVCDDGSSDATANIANELDATVIQHKKNMGYGAAINSIFKKSVEIDSDILITFDADGQHRIEDIGKILEPIKNGDADIVIGSRFLKQDSEIPNYRKVGIKLITKVTNASLKECLTDSQSGLRAYNNSVLKSISPSEFGMGISTEILIKASKNNFRIIEVPIKVLYGKNTSTHNPIKHGTSVLISTIKYTSIERPLYFYGIPSVIFLIIGGVFTYLSIQYYTEIGRLNTNLVFIAGGTIVIGIILFISAILLFTLVSVVREKR